MWLQKDLQCGDMWKWFPKSNSVVWLRWMQSRSLSWTLLVPKKIYHEEMGTKSQDEGGCHWKHVCFFAVAGYGNRGRGQQKAADHGGGFCEGRGWYVITRGPQDESDFLLMTFFHWESAGRMWEPLSGTDSMCLFSSFDIFLFSLFGKLLGIKINLLYSVCCLWIVFVHQCHHTLDFMWVTSKAQEYFLLL